MANFNDAINLVYQYEGGFQNQKADTGNYLNGQLIGTNLGITPGAYKAYYKKEPTVDTIKSLTKPQASPIYKKNYWDKIRGDEISNDSIAKLMMDTVVNSGTGQITSFKHLMNETAGKKIVAETPLPFTSAEIVLLNGLPQSIYFDNLKTFRKRFYEALVQKKPSNKIYLKGWLSRLDKHVYSGAISNGGSSVLPIVGGILLAGGIAWIIAR